MNIATWRWVVKWKSHNSDELFLRGDEMSETIAERIMEIKGKKSLKDLALETGVPSGTIHNYIKKRREPSLNFVVQLCNSLNVNEKWILTGEGPKYREGVSKSLIETDIKEIEKKIGIKCATPDHMIQCGEHKPHQLSLHSDTELNEKDYVLVPYLDAQAPEQLKLIREGQARCHLAFSKYWIEVVMSLSPVQILITSVIGDSMEPTLKEGDILLVDRRKKEIKEDAIYVISIKDLIMPKRVQRMFNGVICVKSDNPAYKEQIIPKEVSADLHVIGRAVWVGRRI